MAILYFREPTKGWSAAVVVIFSLVFTIALTMVPHIRLETIFIGLSAYIAILVAFLANFQGGGHGKCGCSG